MENTHFKDTSPSKTISNLQKKIKDLGIILAEHWNDESSINTFSLRLSLVDDISVGVNGKGVTKEYALASAYGEFFERLQNGALTNLLNFSDDFNFKYFFDEENISAMELVNGSNSFVNMFFEHCGKTDLPLSDKALLFNDIFSFNNEEQNGYPCIPYYNTKTKKLTSMPVSIIYPYYGSTGMSAGNTREEALVQAISEVFERYIIRKTINEQLVFPDIPESYIKKFPEVYSMYLQLKKYENYSCILKDCSCGGKYPVAALIIIEKNTGKYGINFGCHPNFGIAMERTFTEASQGQDILQFAKRNSFDFNNKFTHTDSNFANIFAISKGSFPYQLFSKDCHFEFTPMPDVSTKTNKELLNEWVNKLNEEGYEILIRDNSVLDFPTFQIIIPHLSELQKFSEVELKYDQAIHLAIKLIKKPSQINSDNIQYLIAILEHYLPRHTQNSLSAYYKRTDSFIYPFSSYNFDCVYFLMVCHIFYEKYDKALYYNKMLSQSKSLSKKDRQWLLSLQFYFNGRKIINNHEEVLSYLTNFFDKSITDKLDTYYQNLSRCIQLQYPDDIVRNEKQVHSQPEMMRKLKEMEIKQQINQMRTKKLFE